jgi:hypothetical protein
MHEGKGKEVVTGEDEFEDMVERRRNWPVLTVKEGGGMACWGESRWHASMVRRR